MQGQVRSVHSLFHLGISREKICRCVKLAFGSCLLELSIWGLKRSQCKRRRPSLGWQTKINLSEGESENTVLSEGPNQQSGKFLKKEECTGQLSNTTRSKRPQKTTEVDHYKFITRTLEEVVRMYNQEPPSWKRVSRPDYTLAVNNESAVFFKTYILTNLTTINLH